MPVARDWKILLRTAVSRNVLFFLSHKAGDEIIDFGCNALTTAESRTEGMIHRMS